MIQFFIISQDEIFCCLSSSIFAEIIEIAKVTFFKEDS